MPEEHSLRQAISSLWFRLTTVIISGLVFAEALELGSGKIRGWSFYLTPAEVTFEVAVRLIFAALIGLAFGTVSVVLLSVFVWLSKSRRETVIEWSTNLAVLAVVFLDGRLALAELIKWAYQISDHRGIYDRALFGLFYLVFAE